MERIEEYNALRQEIMQKDLEYNEYRKNAYTVTTAVLAFSLTQSEPFICLMPIIIVVALYLISENSLRAMAKIGAYLRVFYDEDGFLWERRNMSYHERFRGDDYNKEIFNVNAMIYIALIIICGMLSLFKTYVLYTESVAQHPMLLNNKNSTFIQENSFVA